MRKRYIVLMALSALMLCLCLVIQHRNAAPPDSNLEYIRKASVPDVRCAMTYTAFEPTAPIWKGKQVPNETRDITDPQALERIVEDALGRTGELIAPYPDCENCHTYVLELAKTTKPVVGTMELPPTCVTLYFLVEDGAFKPVVYMDLTTDANARVWYTFDDPQEFVETYWDLAVPADPY